LKKSDGIQKAIAETKMYNIANGLIGILYKQIIGKKVNKNQKEL
jgi:hypothetical protein